MKQITVKFSFPTALDPTEIPQPSADWKVLGKDKEVGAPVVTDSVIQDYQKAKYAGSKGQYRKAYRMFSSRRTVSVKILNTGTILDIHISRRTCLSLTREAFLVR